MPTDRLWTQGFYVEVDTTSGKTLRPTVIDDNWSPEINSRPSIEITVPRSERWDELKGQPLRVWKDGYQLPIDTLGGTTQTPETTVLEASGGADLDQYTDDIQIDEQEAHLAAEELIAQYTSYASNVDDPATDTRADVLMLSENGASIEDALVDPIAADEPLDVNQIDGAIMEQTGWFREVEDVDYTGTLRFADTDGNDGGWSGNRCVRLRDAGDGYSFSISLSHEVPADDLRLQQLWAVVDGNPALEISLNGTVVETIPADALSTSADRFDLRWALGTFLNDSTVEPGIHSVSVDVTASGSGDIYADAAHVRDARFSYNFDSDPVDGVIQGPEEYPATVDVVLDDVSSVEQVVGGNLDVVMSSTAGEQAVAISNDGGATWVEATNAESVSGAFASASQQIRARVTLSRYSEDPTTSPAQGDAGQSVDDLELRADLEDTPVLLDKQYRDRLDSVLSSIADDGNFVWELRRDPNAEPDDETGYIVEWTQVGQRTRESTAPVTDFDVRETLEDAYERIVVFGRSRGVEGNEFAAPSDDQVQSIGNEWVVPDSERIYDPDTGEEFARGDDYRIQWDLGGLELLDNSDMVAGETYAADYEYRYRGEATRPDVDPSDARTIERQVPGATSRRECNQLALSILKRLQDAQIEATLSVATDDPSLPLVEALSHPRLPGGTHIIRSVDGDGQTQQYRLANRRTAGEIIDDLREDYEALADVV